MSGKLLPPSLAGEISRLKQRVTDLERVLHGADLDLLRPEAVFSFAGALTPATRVAEDGSHVPATFYGDAPNESPPWYLRRSSRMVHVVALLGVAGSTTTFVDVRKNGTQVAQVEVAPGSTGTAVNTRNIVGADSDRITAAITGGGDGAADLTVQVRFR